MFKALRATRMPSSTRNISSTTIKGDLFRYQKDLPHLPVPTLEETGNKYLRTVEPYLNKAQLQNTTRKVKDFIKPGGNGEKLQSRLTEFAKGQDNWLASFWDNYAYLSYRDPVVPYVSYFFLHKDLTNAIGKDPVLKASLIAYYTIQFMIDVQTERLEPEIIKGNAYCMNAFHYMFNNSRVPGDKVDTTKIYNGEEHRYFIVIANNHFYKVYHHTKDDKPLSKAELYKQILYIYQDAHNHSKAIPVGALTTLNRDELYGAYRDLAKSPVNQDSLEAIYASSFVICLDDKIPTTVEERTRNCWHGDGKNRFFDKPLQFFVGKNGNSGFLGEHSRMDATPTVQLNNYVLSELFKEDPAKLIREIANDTKIIEDLDIESIPKTLPFDISLAVRNEINNAVVKFENTVSSLDAEVLQYYGYGKNLIKKFKVSPDAYAQMMMQLAYYKLTGKVRPTYESAATRKYLKGRTETGRSVSVESLNFVKTFTDPEASAQDKVNAFHAAAKQHVKYLLEAADGRGVDRHFLGLKQMLKPGEPVPEIFTDEVFGYSATWFLSTSQVPSEYFAGWGWSQVIDEGFGLAYLVNNDWLFVHISTRKGNGLSSKLMKAYLTETAEEMKQVLSTSLESKPKL